MPIVKNNISKRLSGLSKALKKTIPAEAHDYYRSITPIDTGNARNKTKLRGTSIVADYHYASYLEKGHSKQAPQGMTKPLFEWLHKRVQRLSRQKL